MSAQGLRQCSGKKDCDQGENDEQCSGREEHEHEVICSQQSD